MLHQDARDFIYFMVSLYLCGCQGYSFDNEQEYTRDHSLERSLILDSSLKFNDLKRKILSAQLLEPPKKRLDPPSRNVSVNQSHTSSKKNEIPIGIQCIQRAYSSELDGDRLNDRTGELVFKNGESIRWDDKSSTHLQYPVTEYEWQKLDPNPWRTRAHNQMLNQESVLAMMYQRYPALHEIPQSIAKDFEPGRVRHEGFFKLVYGASAQRVSSQLRTINWFGKKIKIHKKAYQSLQKVIAELKTLPQKLHTFFRQSSGTYYWRYIKGTQRLSMHSFGVAIDIAVRHAHYWKWTLKVRKLKAKDRIPYQNQFPMEVVEIFEKNGWAWGGRWYHHDTMHFEYRPALLHPLCADLNNKGEPRDE